MTNQQQLLDLLEKFQIGWIQEPVGREVKITMAQGKHIVDSMKGIPASKASFFFDQQGKYINHEIQFETIEYGKFD